ncbi:MAG TPA: GntR family transcriptional regulator [Actinomycetota bacterium]|nr:GntR family transcriptional regulator [Actinomycetota bacterium]
MILSVDPEAPIPPYEQIRSQIASMVATGTLPAETRLPPIRQLADDLGLAGGTVARAYRELEDTGVIATRGRHGSFVVGSPRRQPTKETRGLLDQAAHAFAVGARQLGYDTREALEAVERALGDVPPARNTA